MGEQEPAASLGALAQILAEHGNDPVQARAKLHDLRDSDRDLFAGAALLHLGKEQNGPAAAELALVLAGEPGYAGLLSDPTRLTDDEAAAAAAVLSRTDPEFYRKLLAMRGSADEHRILRILALIVGDERAMTLVPWLRELSDGGNARIASKAVLILCRLTKNPLIAERFLRSPDPRVRANAVEGLWGASHISRVRALLREAVKDQHCRVSVNALVELYRCGETLARPKIEELSRHPDPLFRAAVAWAIGEIGDPTLMPMLEPLQNDQALNVRLSAGRTLKKMRASAASA